MTVLYRFFDTTNLLLYVGISDHTPHRWNEHAKHRHWWTDVATITLERYTTREAAIVAEREAIRDETPLHDATDVLHRYGEHANPVVGITSNFITAHFPDGRGLPVCGSNTVHSWQTIDSLPTAVAEGIQQCRRCLRTGLQLSDPPGSDIAYEAISRKG